MAAKPAGVDMARAAATPVAAITALAALDALAPTGGETVRVVGASGGVGSFFVQLAAAAGAHIVAPALPEDHDYLRGLGAAEIVDRTDDRMRARERYPDGVDAILDLVSYTPQDVPLRDGGRLASPLGAAGEGADRFNLMSQPTPENLRRLAELLETGRLRVPIQRAYELAQASEAMKALPGSHTQGKLAIIVE